MKRKTKIFVGLLVVILIVTTVFVGITVSKSGLEGNIEQRAFDELRTKAGFYAANIKKGVDDLYIPLETLSCTFENDDDFDLAAERDKTDSIVLNRHYCMLGFADLEGNAISYVGDPIGNIAERNYFKKALRWVKGERAIEYMSTTALVQEPRIIAAVPVRQENRMIGVIFAAMETPDMDKLIVDVDDGEAPVIFVADTLGNIIMSNKSAKNFFKGDDLFKDHISDVAADLANGETVVDNMQKGIGGSFYMNHSGPEYAVYIPLGVEDWYVFSIMTEADAAEMFSKNIKQFRSTTRLLTTAYAVSATIILLIVVYVLALSMREKRVERRGMERYNDMLDMINQTQFDYSYKERNIKTFGTLMEKLGIAMPGSVGFDITDIKTLHPEINYLALIRKITKVKYSAKPDSIVIDVNDKDGMLHKLMVSLIPQYDEKGIINLCGVVLDVTGYNSEHGNHIGIDDSAEDVPNALMSGTGDAKQPNKLYAAESTSAAGEGQTLVFAKTFGHFDIFIDKKPIHFTSKKGKELMAVLIDRHGGTVTSEEAIGILWENEPAGEAQLTRYRKLLTRVKKTLEDAGIGDILISTPGVRSIDTSKIICDYWEAMGGNEVYTQAFHGTYMENYTWGEERAAALEKKLRQ